MVTDGVHQQIPRLGQTTEEDDRLRRGEGDKVGTRLTEDSSRALEDLQSQLVASDGSVEDVLRGDAIYI